MKLDRQYLNARFLCLLKDINRGLICAQDPQIQSSLTNMSIEIAEPETADSNLKRGNKSVVVAFNQGMIRFLTTLNQIVLSRVSGPETDNQPFCHYNLSFRTALNLAMVYFKPQEVMPELEFAMPLNHPYTRVNGALIVGEAAFVIAHEHAHFILGHTVEETQVLAESSAGLVMGYQYAQKFLEQEIKADKLAATLTKNYLSTHEDEFIQDVGFAGPALFFQWLAFCETIVGSLFLNEWLYDLFRMAFAKSYRDQVEEDDNVLVHLHAHPLGTERSNKYLSSVRWDKVTEFTRMLVNSSAQITQNFIADAKNPGRLKSLLKKGSP